MMQVLTKRQRAEALRPAAFRAWSPSALKDYEECPRRTMLERAKRLCRRCFQGVVRKQCSHCGEGEPPRGEALERGERIHRDAEMYIRGQGKLTADLQKVRRQLGDLRSAYRQGQARVELQLAFTRKWKLTEWLAQDVYVRFKLDVLRLLGRTQSRVTDWKTGRYRPEEDFSDQLNGYAVAALSAGFGEEVEAELVFTDIGKPITTGAGRLTLPRLGQAQQALDRRARRMLSDQLFAPRPGRYCTWCRYSANAGGPCEF